MTSLEKKFDNLDEKVDGLVTSVNKLVARCEAEDKADQARQSAEGRAGTWVRWVIPVVFTVLGIGMSLFGLSLTVLHMAGGG